MNSLLSSSSSPYSTMNSTNPSSSNPSKKIKLTIIPPRLWTVVGENSLEEEMLMGSSNHLVRVMLMILVIWVCNQLKMKKCLWIDEFWRVHEEKIDLGNGSSSGGHECVWLLMMSEGDGELVLCIWREFMGRDLFENGMNLDKFREFQMLFKQFWVKIADTRSPSLFKSKRTHDSINNVINAIVEMRIYFHDVGKIDCNRLNTGSMTVKSDSDS
ncbi:hypothetical protein Tco_0558582 [Tanacetum coccineum]